MPSNGIKDAGSRKDFSQAAAIAQASRKVDKKATKLRLVYERWMMNAILLIILIILLIGALPTWPYSSGWGYYPSGGLGLVLLILLILILLGRI